MTAVVLKSIITGSGVPNLFSGAYMAEHLIPSDFPTVQISTNRDVEAELRNIGMESLNQNAGSPPAKAPTTETRTALHAGAMSSNEAARICEALARKVGEVQKPVFQLNSGILQQELPKPVPAPQPVQQPPPVEKIQEPAVASHEPFPTTIRFVEQKDEEEIVEDKEEIVEDIEEIVEDEPGSPAAPELSQGSQAEEQEDQPVNSETPADHDNESEVDQPQWIDMSHKKIAEAAADSVEQEDDDIDSSSSSSSSSENASVGADSLVADEEDSGDEDIDEDDGSEEDSSDEDEEDIDEAVENSSDDDDNTSSSESSDEAPIQIEEKPKHKKRKIPDRSSTAKRQKTYEEEYGEDLVDDGHGHLVPRGKAKKQKQPPKITSTGPKNQLSSFVGTRVSLTTGKRTEHPVAKQSKSKKRYEPTTKTLAYEELCNGVEVEKFYNHPIYEHFKKFWENMIWLAAHDALGAKEDRGLFPHNSMFAGFIQKKVSQTISAKSHWLHKTIYACEKMSAGVLPNGLYRVKFYKPRPDCIDIYNHACTVIRCDDPTEFTAYIRAFQALRPAHYVHYMMLQECNKTKNIPAIGGDPRKLYEHTRTNQKLLDIAFIDWVNMARLSRFEIIDD